MARKDANPGQKEVAATRAAKALDLRIAGKSYRQIAAELSVDVKTAHKYVRHSLDKIAATITAPEKKRWHSLQLERVQAAIASVWQKVEAGDSAAHAALDRLLKREAALLGLDEPARTVLSGDPNAPLRHVVIKEYEKTADFNPEDA